MKLQELQNQALQLPLGERWRLVQSLLNSIQQETLSFSLPNPNINPLSRLLQHLQIASVTDTVIRAALQSSIKDFEDVVTTEAANAIGIEVIVTRNRDDFANSPIPALLPEAFLVMPLE